jgi:hypothetical protein
MSTIGLVNETPGGFKSANRLLTMATSGAAGGFAGFLLSQLQSDSSSAADNLQHTTGVWFMLVVLGIGAGLIAGDAFLSKSPPSLAVLARSAAAIAIGGYIAGYLAQGLYSSMLNEASLDSCLDAATESEFNFCLANAYRGPRMVGWGLAGALGAVGVGLAFQSLKRTQNAIAGGLVGGLLGGFFFDLIPLMLSGGSEELSQVIAMLLIGSLMGVGMSLIDVARTDLWLEVISGEMRGRQFMVMDDRTTIGSARSAAITLLADRSVKEVHVTLKRSSGFAEYTCNTSDPVLVNGTAALSGQVRDGDVLTIGATQLRVGFKRSSGNTSSGTPSTSSGSHVQTPGQSSQPQRRLTASEATAASQGNAPLPKVTAGQATPPTPPPSGPGQRQRPRLPVKGND